MEEGFNLFRGWSFENADWTEVVVSITENAVKQVTHIPDVQPYIVGDEIEELQKVVANDPEVQAALRKRGIDNFEHIGAAPLGSGYYGEEFERTHRIVRSLLHYAMEEGENTEAHPIDGLHVIVDLNEMKVLRIEDHELLPVPMERADYEAKHIPTMRQDIKPLDITQTEGVSFEVNGWEVSWQRWRFRVGFNHQEGLVLYKVGYEDQGELRPIINRAAMAEMTVPYGDSSVTQYRKNFFDAGEYGMGGMTASLELGCDCLGDIYYFDGYTCDTKGEPVLIKNAICLHEEDIGILWKHHDEVRRSRRLVISFISTVGNYDYGFYWHFYQDGTIKFEIKLTGIVATAAVHSGQPAKFGTKYGDSLYAPNHQHFFCTRMDMEVDGAENTVSEVNTVADPVGPENPYGNAFYTQATDFKTELDAQRIIDPFSGRYWQISNPNRKNRMGESVAYKLLPGENILPFAKPETSIGQRGAYMWKHLWVTAYNRDELFPAGPYPNQHPGGAGLPEWTAADRPIENTDVVLWYVIGSHHIPRLEDWPVMPVVTTGFDLKPSGFFDYNPALDVPPTHSDHCHMSE
ncbi:MAG: primary-amine oxidase [Chloroflexota bacterium]